MTNRVIDFVRRTFTRESPVDPTAETLSDESRVFNVDRDHEITGSLALARPEPVPDDFVLEFPEPPPIERASPGGYAYFLDENEQQVLYAKPWPYTGCPFDERTNSTTWKIDGRLFTPSHRRGGHWIFRRVAG